jgi:hypothetical protein
MKRKIIRIVAGLILLVIPPLQAATWWDSGHHVIDDPNVYGEVFLENDASVDVLGGSILKLELFDLSSADIFGGEMDGLWTNDESIVNIHGGTLDWLGGFENSSVNLYAYDVTYHFSGGLHDEGWLEGTYYANDNTFSFSFYGDDTHSHITIVPEPTSLLLLALGGLLLRSSVQS